MPLPNGVSILAADPAPVGLFNVDRSADTDVELGLMPDQIDYFSLLVFAELGQLQSRFLGIIRNQVAGMLHLNGLHLYFPLFHFDRVSGNDGSKGENTNSDRETEKPTREVPAKKTAHGETIQLAQSASSSCICFIHSNCSLGMMSMRMKNESKMTHYRIHALKGSPPPRNTPL